MAERQIVDLVVEGSSPFFHPINHRDCDGFLFVDPRTKNDYYTFVALVAQLDRASDFESAGYRFEPCQAHHQGDFGPLFHIYS